MAYFLARGNRWPKFDILITATIPEGMKMRNIDARCILPEIYSADISKSAHEWMVPYSTSFDHVSRRSDSEISIQGASMAAMDTKVCINQI